MQLLPIEPARFSLHLLLQYSERAQSLTDGWAFWWASFLEEPGFLGAGRVPCPSMAFRDLWLLRSLSSCSMEPLSLLQALDSRHWCCQRAGVREKSCALALLVPCQVPLPGEPSRGTPHLITTQKRQQPGRFSSPMCYTFSCLLLVTRPLPLPSLTFVCIR